MKTETIMTDFTNSIAEVLARTCIDAMDAEILKEILEGLGC